MTHAKYPDIRKVFLQWLFVERIVLFEAANNFFNDCIADIDFGANEDNEKDINVFLDYCKKSLAPISLNIKKQLFVLADRKLEYIGICNLKSDKVAQLATKLSAENIKQFKKIINIAISSVDHEFNLITVEQNLEISRNLIQSLLKDLVENQWLFLNKSTGVYCLGPRTLLELVDFIKEQDEEFPNSDFKDCSLCLSIISSGAKSTCMDPQCSSHYHQFCIDGYAQTTGKSECPKCQKSI